nr:MAG TPA: hypothetical protein [Caudoviricetes sp.]
MPELLLQSKDCVATLFFCPFLGWSRKVYLLLYIAVNKELKIFRNKRENKYIDTRLRYAFGQYGCSSDR